jgi:hypothetical protein
MVERLARGETVRVTIGGVRERPARRQRRQAMLRMEGIEIESGRSRCEKNANARKGNRDESASRRRIKIALRRLNVRRRSARKCRSVYVRRDRRGGFHLHS